MFAIEKRLMVMAGLVCHPALLHGQVPFAVRKEVGDSPGAVPHHTSSVAHPHPTSRHFPPTHMARAAPRGREWSRSGQTRPTVVSPQPGSC